MLKTIINRPKVVLVTGGGQRVGAAIVRQLHAQGWTVLFIIVIALKQQPP
jgi:NAD(P)-dependent dehydrogenase (short-subunit alcohol dehydrogenase family)